MKYVRSALVFVFVMLLLIPAGCSRNDDETAIRNLLGSSVYTDENSTRSYGSSDSTPTSGDESSDQYEMIPFVRFRRYIPPGGMSRVVRVQIPAYPGDPDTTALATITTTINGDFRTMFDTTTNPILIWRKPFIDEAVRTVYLTKSRDRWRIRRLSPVRFATVDPPYELKVARIEVHAWSWSDSDTFRLTTADTLLAKEELPSFVPEDTVWVRVTVSSNGDSSWVFLHHGRPVVPHHRRRAYYRTSTTTFERLWYIGLESAGVVSEVRPSGHDAIGWGTLWADTSKPYVAAAWGVPYIVRQPGQPIPED
ncbi:MAG: hypothetical protein ABIL25_02190 [candidate division WOR-3 bacterium]